MLAQILIQQLQDLRHQYEVELKEIQTDLMDEKYDERLTQKMRNMNRKIHRINYTLPERVKVLQDREADLLASIDRVDDLILRRSSFETESLHPPKYRTECGFDYEHDDKSYYRAHFSLRTWKKFKRFFFTESLSEGPIEVSLSEQENLVDIVGDEVSAADFGSSDGPQVGQTHLLSIDDFFARPVAIDNFTLAMGADLNASYAIWDLYTKTPSVRAKLRNYSFLKGTLCVRVAVSGSPFHYGKILLAYKPYPLMQDTLQTHLSNLALHSIWRKMLLNYLSQSRGSVTLDLNANKPVDIRCPFISPKATHRLYATSNAVLAAGSSYPDLANAGSIYLYSINTPASCSTTPSAVSFQIYAWMEDVELGPPTATQIAITTESGDERVTGPVEKVGTFLATVSNALTKVPVIAPLAKASASVFTGLAQFAAWFGWSVPPVPDKPQFVKNRPYSSTALTIGTATVDKVALDPLQEVSVDPRVVGSIHDEMSIAYLTQVSCYLNSFDWATSDVPLVPTFQFAMTPQLCTPQALINAIQPTPMMFVAECFRYWRGKIKVRLEIVCSRFHRGKFLVMYEPNVSQQPLISAAVELNKNYVRVIDIQETQDVEFIIDYSQPYVWLKTLTPAYATYVNLTSNGTFDGSGLTGFVNGYIIIAPFTELQSPDGSSVHINIYVSGVDMQFNQFTSDHLPTKRGYLTSSGSMDGIDSEYKYSCVPLNSSSNTGYATSEYCFGEQPVSLRSLLKRYVTTYNGSASLSATAHNYIYYNLNLIPPASPVYDGVAYAGSAPTLLEYLPLAYLGVKGGVRKRFVTWNYASSVWQPMKTFMLSLMAPGTTHVNSGPTLGTGVFQYLYEEGTAVAMPQTNAGVEVEFPYYSPNLFHFSCNKDFGTTVSDDSYSPDWTMQYVITCNEINPSTTQYYREDTATAEDFTFMRFEGAPYFSF